MLSMLLLLLVALIIAAIIVVIIRSLPLTEPIKQGAYLVVLLVVVLFLASRFFGVYF